MIWKLTATVVALTLGLFAQPKAGPVPIFKEADLKPGMKATAWTVFSGTEAEAVPVEIVGIWKNAWGPKQDIILAKMGGRALFTNVAGGMSGSPVYIDGKLVGAVALRMSVFSPEAICGITPIENMLEINDLDASKPTDPKAPLSGAKRASLELPGDLLRQVVDAGASPSLLHAQPMMVPIETPIALSGFTDRTLKEFGPMFQQMGLQAVQGGGAAGSVAGDRLASDWKESLRPGETIAGVLVSGDKSITGMGTVTYNDGKRVLAFGHPFFNLGQVSMPMSKGEIIMVLASQFQPNKFGNATDIVGALKQDRHSGIMGQLGEVAETVPVSLKVRSYGPDGKLQSEKPFHFNFFVQQKWTPFLFMLTLFDSINSINEFGDDMTYRFSSHIEMEGNQNFDLRTMQAPNEGPTPAPMMLAGWVGEKFNKLYGNSVEMPRLKRVDAVVDLIPERRTLAIEQAWLPVSEVEPGAEVPVKIYLRPFRGERVEREVMLKLPQGLSKGEHRILLSDADTLDRIQSRLGNGRFLNIPQMVSLIEQERSNTKLYVSLIEPRPTVFTEDKALPSLPGSVLNVMQTGRTGNRILPSIAETAQEQTDLELDQVVSGAYSLRFTVR
jgi:hypothetical protein